MSTNHGPSAPVMANNHYVDRCMYTRAGLEDRYWITELNWFNLQTKQSSDILTPTCKKNSGVEKMHAGAAGLLIVVTIDDDQDVYVR